MYRSIVAACLLFVMVGCGDDGTGPEDPTVDGSWVGVMVVDDLDIELRMSLAETDEVVTGSGSIGEVGGGVSITFSVETGTHTYPDLTLTLGSPGTQDFFFNGTVSSTSISGTVTGSGFGGESVTLSRQ